MKNKVLKKDYEKFYVLKPEPAFSPDHNKRVVEGTIKKYEAKQKAVMAKFRDGIAERSNMVASYLRTGAYKSIDKYLGKKIMLKLHGQEIIDRLKMINKPSFTIGQVAEIARKKPTAKINAKKKL